MLTQLTGKEKAARVPLDYFRQAGSSRWRWMWYLLVCSLAVVGFGWVSGSWKLWANPGSLHRVHAAFEDNCAACHAPLQPTTSGNGLQTVLGTGPVSDALCQTCHQGPPHHPHRLSSATEGTCSSCHAEHRGRNAPLSQPQDAQCVSCHGDLASQVIGQKPHFAPVITHFSNHPPFRLGPPENRQPLAQSRDPAHLEFNHALHLAPGQAVAGSNRPKTLKEIPEPYRTWYRASKAQKSNSDDALVQLDCASCHQSDPQDQISLGGSNETERRLPGDYLLPIDFNKHCKACHPLTLAQALPQVEIPHPMQPKDVEAFLWGELARVAVAPAKPEQKVTWPLPGANQPRTVESVKERFDRVLQGIDGKLYQQLKGPEKDRLTELIFAGKFTCMTCHQAEPMSPPGVAYRSLKPTRIPEMWLEHGGFNHVSHRGVNCLECHGPATGSVRSADILLPDVDNCKKCHGPAHATGGHHLGGAPHQCATCHKYHNGAQPRSGPGSASRAPANPKTLQDFLDDR